jgi:hypothetical protein
VQRLCFRDRVFNAEQSWYTLKPRGFKSGVAIDDEAIRSNCDPVDERTLPLLDEDIQLERGDF